MAASSKTTRPAAPTPAARPASPKPMPAAASPARAPGGPPAIRLGGSPAQGGDVAAGVLELKGMTEFKPPAAIAEVLDASKTSAINARFGNLAQGPIEVKTVSKGKYQIKDQPLGLAHPAFARVAEFAPGLAPALIIKTQGSKLTGEVGLAGGKRIEKISTLIQQKPEMLGLAGFTISSLPTITNTIEGGSLHLGLKGVRIKLGSAFAGTFNFEVIDTSVAFDGNADVKVKGLADGKLEMKRTADALITGKGSVGLTLPKNFSGGLDVAWDGVSITGQGKVGYKGEKFSGEVTLNLMEKKQAEQLAEAKKAPEGAAPQAGAAASTRKGVTIEYAVFGEGDLAFAFTEWLNGNAHVIVDPKGNLTVIGKITPQKEFTLFEQKDYVKPLFKLEARASYGIPVVGNIFIFANVGMDLFAKLGPAKFYNIVIDGTYSTDPKVARNFSIRGSLNISAAAGARLRAEAGAGLEILAHDIKAGAGINGIAGIKAYAEATPTVGYKEQGAEGQDLKGVWFIRGDLEIAAQPFLGLSGDLFVEIDAPWWSPVPDKKWTWPLGGKEWPLGGSIGMLVSVDYVFGSGQWPKFDLKPVEFNSEKFMTNLYEDKAKSGSGKELEQKGKWAEKNSKGADVPKGKAKGNLKEGKLTDQSKATSKKSSKKDSRIVDSSGQTKLKKAKDEKEKGKKSDGKDQGEAIRPLVHVPFAMAGASHDVTFEPKGDGVEIDMASNKLPLTEKFKQAHVAIDNFKHYMLSITVASIQTDYQTNILPKIDALQAPQIAEFNSIYEQLFPKRDKKGKRPIEKAEAKTHVQSLITKAQALLAELKAWGAATGIKDLSKEAVDNTLKTQGDAIWRKAFEKMRSDIIAVIRSHTYKGVPVKFTGSSFTGWRGPHKGQTHFDPGDFDVDLYVVHPVDYAAAENAKATVVNGKIFPTARYTPQLLDFSRVIVGDLTRAFPGIVRVADSCVVLRKTFP